MIILKNVKNCPSLKLLIVQETFHFDDNFKPRISAKSFLKIEFLIVRKTFQRSLEKSFHI